MILIAKDIKKVKKDSFLLKLLQQNKQFCSQNDRNNKWKRSVRISYPFTFTIKAQQKTFLANFQQTNDISTAMGKTHP